MREKIHIQKNLTPNSGKGLFNCKMYNNCYVVTHFRHTTTFFLSLYFFSLPFLKRAK